MTWMVGLAPGLDLKDKIKTKSISQLLKMLSINQINAQVKLTEMWKAMNIEDYPIKGEIQVANEENRTTFAFCFSILSLDNNIEWKSLFLDS